ncbi:MAG TPA: hypothetical protein VEK11_19315 [Thermoanaerobaculia bacterium]|nr:hypothetical protein [Thermoanaerobaculia bacterium]
MKKTLLLLLAIAPFALADDVTGRFDAGSRYEEPALHAPPHVSRMFARSIPRTGANASVELPATGGSGMIVWTIPARRDSRTPVTTQLRTPEGNKLERSERGSAGRGLRRFKIDAAESAELGVAGGAQDVVHVMHTAAASYHLDIDMPDDVAGVTVVAAEPESRLVLSTWAAPLSRQPGEPVTLHAELRNRDMPIAGASVTARLASPRGRAFETIELADRGDGVYTATIADLPERAHGAWQVRFEAEGVTAEGVRFARTGSGELVAERGAARLRAIETEVDGDTLRVRVPAQIHAAGTYRFDVILADGAKNGVAWGEGVRKLETGETTLELRIPLAHLGETNIDALRIDARLLGLDEIGLAGRITN